MMFCDVFWSTHHYIVTILPVQTIFSSKIKILNFSFFQLQLRIVSKSLMCDRSRSEPGGVVGSVPEPKCAFFRIAFVGRRNFVISGRFF